MPIQKEHKEFHPVDMDGEDWHSPPGYPQGIEQKILAGRLDENRKAGNRTRLLRFRPGAYTTAPFVHDYWEEVYLISGDLTVGDASMGSARRPLLQTPTPAGHPASLMVLSGPRTGA